MGMRVSYVGNHSTHLPWYNYPVNLSKEQIAGAIHPTGPINRGPTFCCWQAGQLHPASIAG
jgi:hypothetical protein